MVSPDSIVAPEFSELFGIKGPGLFLAAVTKLELKLHSLFFEELMHSSILLKVRTCFLPLVLSLGLLQACGAGSSKAPDQANPGPAPVPAILPLVQGCGDGFADGQSQQMTLFRSEFAPLDQACKDLSYEGTVTCSNGQKVFQDSGSTSCEETELRGLTILGGLKEIEIGQNLALTLEGRDQRDGKVSIESSKAKWSSNIDLVTVSVSGVVSGKSAVQDAVITATLGKLSAQYHVIITGKSCDDTHDGASKLFPRFKEARVPFNSACAPLAVEGLCSNGTFTFAEGTSETCEPANLTQLIADPASLFLKKNESAKVNLFLLDDIGTRVALAAHEATWELPAGDAVKLDQGTVTVLKAIPDGITLKVSAQGLSASISVSSPKEKPQLIGFVKNQILMKAGDEQVLEVRSTLPVELDQLNWESSDVTLVTVEAGKIKALKPDGEATVTAKLDGKIIEAKIKVEAVLKLDASAVVYTSTQKGKVHPLTQDKLSLLPAYIATIQGLTADQKPELSSVTEGCQFSVRLSRQKWEISAELDENQKSLPAQCEAQLILNSKAGQNITQKFVIPVDYNKVTLTESLPKTSDDGMEVARIGYKFSSSYSITSAEVKPFENSAFSACEWSLLPEDQGYRVIAKGDGSKTCAGQVVIKMLDSNDKLTLTYTDMVVVSANKPFADLCASPDSAAIKLTVSAMRQQLAPSVSCENLARFIRGKNLNAVVRNSEFALALDNKNLTDLSPLARFVGLQELSLAANRQLVDIQALRDLKLLKMLNLKFTAVSDFTAIFQHTLITDLRLPVGAAVTCNPEITNNELTKICR